MRLIDADLLDEVLDDKFEGCYALDVNYIQDDIIPNIPTVDAVPRELYESMGATCYKLQQALSESWVPCSERLPDALRKGDVIDMIRALHAQIDELELEIQRLQGELTKTKKALYIACSDYYSLHYPNGHRAIEDIFDD